MNVAIYEVLIVKDSRFHITKLFVLTAVKDIRLRNVSVSRLDKHGLNAILDIFNLDNAILYLRLEVSRYLEREKVDNVRCELFVKCFKCFCNSTADLTKVKFSRFAISF